MMWVLQESLQQPNLLTINGISSTKYLSEQLFEAVQKKEKSAPEALQLLVESNWVFEELQQFCERCAVEASHAMFDLMDLWDHKDEPDWRGLVCSLVDFKKVMLTWAASQESSAPMLSNETMGLCGADDVRDSQE